MKDKMTPLKPTGTSTDRDCPYDLLLIKPKKKADKIVRLHNDHIIMRVYTDFGRYDYEIPCYIEQIEKGVTFHTDYQLKFVAQKIFRYFKITMAPSFYPEHETTSFEPNKAVAGGNVATIKFDTPKGILTLIGPLV